MDRPPPLGSSREPPLPLHAGVGPIPAREVLTTVADGSVAVLVPVTLPHILLLAGEGEVRVVDVAAVNATRIPPLEGDVLTVPPLATVRETAGRGEATAPPS